MAGRADEREGAALDGLARAACREQRRFPAGRRGDGVRVEQGRDLERREPVEVVGVVAALDLFARGGPAFDHVEGVQQCEQPLPRVGVRLDRVELREERMAYEVDRTAAARRSRSAPPPARPTR